MTVTITKEIFLADKQGCKFKFTVEDPITNFDKLLKFFNDESRQSRLECSEIHFNQPALAGVIKELESPKWFGDYFSKNTIQTTYRTRQAVGTLVRIIMESRGWKKTGHKGSLGQRIKKSSTNEISTGKPNISGISKWFTRAERYENQDFFDKTFKNN